jgi:predicted dehydrogenase
MCETAAARKRIGAVAFQFRMEEALVALREEVRGGSLGKVRRIDVRWVTGGRRVGYPWSWQNDKASGGGIIEGFASHVVDYIEWLSGHTILDVVARSQTLVPWRKDKAGVERSVTAEDTCDILLGLTEDMSAHIRITNASPVAHGHRIEVDLERGTLIFLHSAPFDKPARVWVEIPGGEPRSVFESSQYRVAADSRMDPFVRLAGSFIRALSGSTEEDLPAFSAGMRVRSILASIHASVESRAMRAVNNSTPQFHGLGT